MTTRSEPFVATIARATFAIVEARRDAATRAAISELTLNRIAADIRLSINVRAPEVDRHGQSAEQAPAYPRSEVGHSRRSNNQIEAIKKRIKEPRPEAVWTSFGKTTHSGKTSRTR